MRPAPRAGGFRLLVLFAGLWFLGSVGPAAGAGEWRLYAGQYSGNEYDEIVLGELELQDSYIGTLGWMTPLGKPHRWFRLEAELNYTQHTGLQHFGELNGALGLRLVRFPWDESLPTTFAMGIGPSYAFETPPLERRFGNGERLLNYWYTELTLDPRPSSPWALLGRIHHRSSIFGLASDAYGSNFIAVGVRYRR